MMTMIRAIFLLLGTFLPLSTSFIYIRSLS